MFHPFPTRYLLFTQVVAVDVSMNNRQDSLISLGSSENDLSGADTDSEEQIVMRWISDGSQMLTRALSQKDSQNEKKVNQKRISFSEQPCDPRIAKLKEKLEKKEKQLYQLENQEKTFLGMDNQRKDTTIFRIEFEATTRKDYYLIAGCPETFIPAGKTVTIFGQLRNKRWRCVVEHENNQNSNLKSPSKKGPSLVQSDNDIEDTSQQKEDFKQFVHCCPLIGSIPSSIITELNENTNTDTVINGIDETTCEDADSQRIEDTNLFLCECGRYLPTSFRNSLSRPPTCSLCNYCSSPPASPIKTITPDHLTQLSFQRFPSLSCAPLPNLPESPTESTIAELNMALESLAQFTPRSRPASGGSDCSRNSWSSRL